MKQTQFNTDDLHKQTAPAARRLAASVVLLLFLKEQFTQKCVSDVKSGEVSLSRTVLELHSKTASTTEASRLENIRMHDMTFNHLLLMADNVFSFYFNNEFLSCGR